MVKGIAMYGSYVAYEPVRQRYWKRRRDGIKQRYWKKTKRMKKVVKMGRYEFHGTGKDLMRAVIEAKRRIPRGHVEVPAAEFLEAPEKYGDEGHWIKTEVVS